MGLIHGGYEVYHILKASLVGKINKQNNNKNTYFRSYLVIQLQDRRVILPYQKAPESVDNVDVHDCLFLYLIWLDDLMSEMVVK